MKLLISAFACAPNRGSEEALGWTWTTEAHRLGHQVWALVWPIFRGEVEEACRTNPDLKGIRWFFPEVKGWAVKPATKPKWERTYCLMWQRAALSIARELCCSVEFDAIHHVTWGGLRVPTFLGSLGRPLIIGPIGGGETSPLSLRDEFPLRGRILERIRDFANATVTINPSIRRELIQAAAVYAATPDTRDLLGRRLQHKTFIFSPVSIDTIPATAPRAIGRASARLLYAGRLLYWKGVHILVKAFARLLEQVPNAHLTIVGDGPEKGRLKAAVLSLHIEDKVDFISRLPQNELFELYDDHDLFVFPSLHDSGGFVVVEAMSRGLPVICLDLGGPKHLVTEEAGVVVPTSGRNTEQVATAMANEMSLLLAEPARLMALSQGAVARARDFLPSRRVAEFYARAARFIGLTDDTSPQTELLREARSPQPTAAAPETGPVVVVAEQAR